MKSPGYRTRIVLAQFVILAVFVVIIETVVRLQYVSDLYLPLPTQIGAELSNLVRTGELLRHVKVTATEFLLGLGLAIPFAILLGIIIGTWRSMENLAAPFLAAGMSIPWVAVAPLLIIQFGIGTTSKVVLALLSAFFPIVYNTTVAVKEVDPLLVKVARSLGAGQSQVIRKVIFPASLPIILTGVRVGAARALVATIIGEMIAAQAGLGWMIAVAAGLFRTDQVFAGLVILSTLSIIALAAIGTIEQKITFQWKGKHKH